VGSKFRKMPSKFLSFFSKKRISSRTTPPQKGQEKQEPLQPEEQVEESIEDQNIFAAKEEPVVDHNQAPEQDDKNADTCNYQVELYDHLRHSGDTRSRTATRRLQDQLNMVTKGAKLLLALVLAFLVIILTIYLVEGHDASIQTLLLISDCLDHPFILGFAQMLLFWSIVNITYEFANGRFNYLICWILNKDSSNIEVNLSYSVDIPVHYEQRLQKLSSILPRIGAPLTPDNYE
jgi:uncharacterized membrane protein (DUF485 family)